MGGKERVGWWVKQLSLIIDLLAVSAIFCEFIVRLAAGCVGLNYFPDEILREKGIKLVHTDTPRSQVSQPSSAASFHRTCKKILLHSAQTGTNRHHTHYTTASILLTLKWQDYRLAQGGTPRSVLPA